MSDAETLTKTVAQGETIRAMISDAEPDTESMSDAEFAAYLERDEDEESDNVVKNDDGSQTWNNQEIEFGDYESLPIQVSAPMAAILERLGAEEPIVDLRVDLLRDGDSYRMLGAIDSGMMHLEDGSIVEL